MAIMTKSQAKKLIAQPDKMLDVLKIALESRKKSTPGRRRNKK